MDSEIRALVTAALAEDIGTGDITSALIEPTTQGTATIKTRSTGLLCGQAWLNEVFQQVNGAVNIHWLKKDGDALQAEDIFCELSGPLADLLTAERTALNFLQMLSGTATFTRYCIQAMGEDLNTQLLDTRKTIPGCRHAQKYAVVCGGGSNHRMGLYDAYLIKENHISALGGLTAALTAVKAKNSDQFVEVEVETLEELEIVFPFQLDRVMLDNFNVEQTQLAVQARDAYHQKSGFYTVLELSGNVYPGNIRRYALTGVDAISVGMLTKNVISLDFSMQIKQVN